VYANTKPFVYNYVKRVVLLMVMEHAASKLFKKVPTPKHYKPMKKPTIYKPHTYTHPHITKPTHIKTYT